MKIYSKALVSLAVVMTASLAQANSYFMCNEGSVQLGLAHLSCVSCGIQKYYYKNKNAYVTPSEKWLAMLALNARAYRTLDPSGVDDITRSEFAKGNMQKLVIAGVQAYGFCHESSYPGSMSPFLGYLTHNQNNLSTAQLEEAAKLFGFNGDQRKDGQRPGAHGNMFQLIDDEAYQNQPMSVKRQAYDARITAAARNRTVRDQGLAACVNETQKNTQAMDGDAIALCKTMAEECGIHAGFCSEPYPGWNKSSTVEVRNLPPLSNPSQLPPPPTGLGTK